MASHPLKSDPKPEAPTGPKRRRGPRLTAALPVFLAFTEDGRKILEQTVTDKVSRFGCGVFTQRKIAPGTGVEVEYSGRRREGRVVYTLRHSNTRLLELGIAFEQDAAEFWGLDFGAPSPD